MTTFPDPDEPYRRVRRSRTMPLSDFMADSKTTYDALYALASADMTDPAFVASGVTFCRFVDPDDFPLDECGLPEANFATLTVMAEDRADPAPNVFPDRPDHVRRAPTSLTKG